MLNFKNKCECYYDEISLGEVMLRFDPGDDRVRTARSFKVWEGGGEYNAARGLSKCFGLRTSVLTGLPDNDLGLLALDFINQGNVDSSFIKWYPYDGIGKSVRLGLNFTERGFGVRGATGTSDRANSAASLLTPDDFDFEHIFGEKGVRLLHTGGIYAALSKSAADTAKAAVTAAKKHGTLISYDLNYRPSLWQYNGGLDKAREVNRELVKNVDILIGNEEDYYACLNIGKESNLSKLNKESYKEILFETMKLYPNIKLCAVTLRTVKTATINDWTAMCAANGEIYEGMEFNALEIYDRVGGGDSFASGLLYGLLTNKEPGEALNYGICHGALAMTTPGDTSRASLKEVQALIKGMGARVQR